MAFVSGCPCPWLCVRCAQLPDMSPAWLQTEAIKEGKREYVTAGLQGLRAGSSSGAGAGVAAAKADGKARLSRELVRVCSLCPLPIPLPTLVSRTLKLGGIFAWCLSAAVRRVPCAVCCVQ
jgi:hypothetical protein